jgi:phosphomannomutase
LETLRLIFSKAWKNGEKIFQSLETCYSDAVTLRIASFGVRGFVGTSLTPKVAMDFAGAFAAHVNGGRVLLGRDSRGSSRMLHSAVTSSLLGAGCEVLNFALCPTPLLQFSVRPYHAAGAISISGGHNAMGWNALTFIGADGAFLDPVGGEALLDRYHAGALLLADWAHMGTLREERTFAAPYFDALERKLDVVAIRKARPVVLIDPVGGAGCPFLDEFAERFGFQLRPINAQLSAYLAREPEPRPRSAMQMAGIIKQLNGDVGFLLSSDLTRLSIVTETGEPASEEFTFAVIANHILGQRVGTVVTNSCTTRMIDDIAAQRGARLVKTRVGQAYIVSILLDEQGVLGGEGSGSVVLPEFSRGFDGFLMMGLVLEAMAQRGRKISELLAELPRYHIVKRQVRCDLRHVYRALDQLEAQLLARPDAGTVDLTDGFRMDWPDAWIHARASRTEQMIRVTSEARTREAALRRADELEHMIEQEI